MAEENTEEEGKKSNLVLYIAIGVGGIVLLAVGLVIGYLLFGGAPDPSEEVTEIIEEQVAAENETEGEGEEVETGPKRMEIAEPPEYETTYWPFPQDITVNLSNSRKFVQISMSLSTQYDSQVIENIEAHVPALQSVAIAVIADFEESMMKTRKGKDELRIAIRDALNEELVLLTRFGGIEQIHFTKFIIQ